jgi:hypothetical protein
MPYEHVAVHALQTDSMKLLLCLNSNITTRNQHIRPIHFISEPARDVATEKKEANERSLTQVQHLRDLGSGNIYIWN